MSSKVIMIIVVLLVLGVGGYFLTTSMPSASNPSIATINPSPNPINDIPTDIPVNPSMSISPAPAEAMLSVTTDPKLGSILVGNNGMTLYAYTKDTADTSTCTGVCLVAWPALITQGNPTLGTGVNEALVGTATMEDGSKIVTYNHLPLYYYSKDSAAGDVTGQNVGEVWFVVSPQGKMIQK
jgi:predicted lipoprotein with Yx(FWY)xxD motif